MRWDHLPEDRLAGKELRRVIDAVVAALPTRQREVITARDVVGMDAAEVALVLGLSNGNQRVLLHRARSKVRAALERYAADILEELPVPRARQESAQTPPPQRGLPTARRAGHRLPRGRPRPGRAGRRRRAPGAVRALPRLRRAGPADARLTARTDEPAEIPADLLDALTTRYRQRI